MLSPLIVDSAGSQRHRRGQRGMQNISTWTTKITLLHRFYVSILQDCRVPHEIESEIPFITEGMPGQRLPQDGRGRSGRGAAYRYGRPCPAFVRDRSIDVVSVTSPLMVCQPVFCLLNAAKLRPGYAISCSNMTSRMYSSLLDHP